MGKILYGLTFVVLLPIALVAWATYASASVQLPTPHWPAEGWAIAGFGLVLIVEAMAQVGGVVLTQMTDDIGDGLFMFAGIDKVRFRRPVVPGDQLVMTVELLSVKARRFGKMHGRAVVDGQLACEGELMFALVS